MSLKSSFMVINETNSEQHPLLFLDKNDRCWAFAKAQRGYFYLVHKGSTWKVYHVNRRNAQKEFTVVWRKYLPKYTIPLSREQLAFIEEKVIDAKVKIYRYKSRYPRDKQVNKVYTWERKFDVLWPDVRTVLSPDEARALANEVVIDLGLRPIKVIHRNPRKNGRYDALAFGGYRIDLFKTTRLDLLHELGHTTMCQLSKRLLGAPPYKFQVHGPQFVAFYSYLLHRYGGVEKSVITNSLTWDEVQRDNCLLKLLEDTFSNSATLVIDSVDQGESE